MYRRMGRVRWAASGWLLSLNFGPPMSVAADTRPLFIARDAAGQQGVACNPVVLGDRSQFTGTPAACHFAPKALPSAFTECGTSPVGSCRSDGRDRHLGAGVARRGPSSKSPFARCPFTTSVTKTDVRVQPCHLDGETKPFFVDRSPP